MRKRSMKKIIMIITTAVVVGGAAVSNVIPVFAEPDEERGSAIVVDEGEAVLDTADENVVQDELDILYREVPEIVRIPDEGLTRKNGLKSKGAINYNDGTVLIRAADFAYLADEIDKLEYLYKVNVKNALNSINTYFPTDGTIVRGNDMANVPEESALSLSFAKLYDGILRSQSVEHLADQQIYAAIADNLTFGTAAWVNGNLIIGNGADNKTSYEKGYIEGFKKATDSVDISYIYHEHVGEQVDKGSGCYKGYHTHTSSCPYYTERCNASPVNDLGSTGGDDDKTHEWICSKGHYYMDGPDSSECHYEDTIYTCGNMPYNGWSISCGKIAGVSIDSATLVFK